MIEGIEDRNYTTKEFGNIVGVCESLVRKWFDSGKLKGFKIPGSRFRRIPHSSAYQFCEENNIPVEVIEQYHRYNSAQDL